MCVRVRACTCVAICKLVKSFNQILGEFFDDFSASSTDRGVKIKEIHHCFYILCIALVTCREMLGLPPNEVVEVAPEKYPRYEV